MGGTLDFETKKQGRHTTVRREEFEQALVKRVTTSGGGWDSTFAMVTLGLMFISRSITDVASATDRLAGEYRQGRRER